MNKPFWLGLIGAVFGILIGIMFIAIGYLSGAGFFDPYMEEIGMDLSEYAGLYYGYGAVSMICSIVGVIGGTLTRQKPVGGVLMIASGIIMLLFTSIFGALTFIFFLIGGILMLNDYYKERKAGSAYQYQYPTQPGQPMPYPPQQQVQPAEQPSQGGLLFCPRCGVQATEPGQRYCDSCGKKLE
ncbi:DUF4064 domain-containing protein [Methanomassiliicoccus luminyensis]|uniref:DUF4064 domain-containing protein n=1 Tax=Methanomassiliicoccus luminyensis TaxID=1080712 RepID=UPI0003653A37|nr:DUF4064 domain-containing protein [Methanomassiliicoccus luminyensis]